MEKIGNTGLGSSVVLFVILFANLIYQKNIFATTVFLIGSFLVFDTYRRIHRAYSKR